MVIICEEHLTWDMQRIYSCLYNLEYVEVRNGDKISNSPHLTLIREPMLLKGVTLVRQSAWYMKQNFE